MTSGTAIPVFDYVSNDSDPALRKWWAEYQKFGGGFEQAEKYYHQCQDYLLLVRVFCCLERIDEADKLANETGDYAALWCGITNRPTIIFNAFR